MKKLKCEDILKATGGILVHGDANVEFGNISTDSRNVASGDLFIPIVGERFDGHEFVDNALKSGAAGALTQKEVSLTAGGVIISVNDTLKAFGDIARYYREKFSIPVIAITGSVGKTSTKDMIAGVLAQRLNVLKTEGNFNNEIGMPKTILSLEDHHEAAVLEMGMRGLGQISYLSGIAKPQIAIITNIGLSHIELLGSRQNILKAKLEILDGLSSNGLVILNGDDDLLSGLRDLLKFRTVFYGIGEGADYQAYNIQTAGEHGSSYEISIKGKEYKVNVPVPGIHNIYNSLAAIAAGLEAGIPMEIIVDGILSYSPGNMRQNIISCKGYRIINDVYNASPQSMEAAISVLKDVAGSGRTIAVLGDMLEMGEWAEEVHSNVGRFAAAKGIDYIITVGENARYIAKGALEAGVSPEKVLAFDKNEEAAAILTSIIKTNDTVLAKGSRGMKMEEIVKWLTNDD